MKEPMYRYQITAMTKPEFPGYRQNVETIWAADDNSAQHLAEVLVGLIPKYDLSTMEVHRLETALLNVY